MNLTKRRKITALITASVMLVALVATVCVLALPSQSYYNGGNTQLTTTDAPADYGIEQYVPCYDNSGVVYTETKEGSKTGYITFQFPRAIYLDKSEKLQDAGYIFQFKTHYKSGYGYGSSFILVDNEMFLLNSLSGYISGYNISVKSNSNGGESTQALNKEPSGFPNGYKTYNPSADPLTMVYNMNSTSNASNLSTHVTYTATRSGNGTNNILGLAYNIWTGKPDMHASTTAFITDTDAAKGSEDVSVFGGSKLMDNVSIDIIVYDKAPLYSALEKLKPFTDAKFKDFLNEIADDSQFFDTFLNFYNEKAAILTDREVTQWDVDDAVAELDNYFAFRLPTFAVKDSNVAYKGSAISIKDFWTAKRFTTEYFNIKINGTQVTSDDNLSVTEVGEYTIQVAPKSSYTYQSQAFSFRWTDNTDEYKTIGKVTVTPINLTLAGINATVTLPFKNSAYNVNFGYTAVGNSAMSYVGGGNSTSGSTNEYFTNLYANNTLTVKLSLDGADVEDRVLADSLAFTDVDTTTVYYEITPSLNSNGLANYNTYRGYFDVTIAKAKLTLTFSANVEQTYGEAVLDSAGIFRESTFTCEADADEDPDWASSLVADIFALHVSDTATYLHAGAYDIVAVLSDEWSDRVAEVTCVNDTGEKGTYIVKQKLVGLIWDNTPSYYNGQAGHRPSVTVNQNDLAQIDKDNNVNIVPAVVLADESLGGSAIDAGTYAVVVNLNNNDYTYSTNDLADGTFTIMPRPITVTLEKRERDYGSSSNATTAWNNYLASLNVTADSVVQVFKATTTANDGSNALVDMASSVFTVSISATDSDYTSTVDADRYFQVGTYNLTVVAQNDEGFKGKNYAITGVGSQFVVNKATIGYDVAGFGSITYNGTEQTVGINPARLAEYLSGYEKNQYENILAGTSSYGSINITYSTDGSNYVSELKLKDAGEYTIHYSIVVSNHKTLSGTLTQYVDRAVVYLDFTPYTATYGDDLLTSNEIKSLMHVGFYKDINKSSVLTFAEKDFTLRILAGSGDADISELDRVSVASYSASYVQDDVMNNYDIRYTLRGSDPSNVGAYIVQPKTLTIVWVHDVEADWSGDTSYIYNGSAIAVTPTITSGVVAGDTVVPSAAQWGGANPINAGDYTATTGLSQPINQLNYTLAEAEKEFTVVARTVTIMIKNQEADFGNASSVPLSSLINPNNAQALWTYASGSLQFVNSEYTSFELTSEAKREEGSTSYVNAGTYEITVKASNNQAAQNYNVSIYKDGVAGLGGYNADFVIKPIDVHYMGRQFNIDVEKEDTFVTMAQIKNRISLEYGTTIDEFNVEMTDLLWGEDYATVDFKNLDPSLLSSTMAQTRTIDKDDAKQYGRYYIYVRITHPTNYKEFTAKLEVNMQSGWFSIVIDNPIEVSYGYDVLTSKELFDALEITYIQVANPDTFETVDFDDAYALLAGWVANGQVEFFVGAGDTTSKLTWNAFGKYSIYIEVKDASIDYQYFRFLDANHTSGADKITSNIDAYQVGKRLVEIDWPDSLDEVYGEHSDDTDNPSPSHNIQIGNPIEGDSVRLIITYYQIINGKRVLLEEHARNVGSYVAVVTGVTLDDYYKLPTDVKDIERNFEITPLKLTIEIQDRNVLSYGDVNARKDMIDAYLNRPVDGMTRYYIKDADGSQRSDFAYGEDVESIFTFKLAPYTLESGLTYLHATDYTITATAINDNYDLTIIDGTLTINKAAATNIQYTQSQVESITYDGEMHTLIQSNILERIEVRNGDSVALINSVQAIVFAVRLSGDTEFKESNPVKDAATYTFDIKIIAPDHEEVTITGLHFTINQARVEISMTQAEKVYGDSLEDMLKNAGMSTSASMSDWLKKMCNIKLSTEKPVTGIDDDFKFIVIDSERDPDTTSGIIPLEPGTSHDVGTYRVYVDTTVEGISNYFFDFTDSTTSVLKCNADAYKIIPRNVEVTWYAGTTEITSGNYKPEYTGTAVEIGATFALLTNGEYKYIEVVDRNTNVGTGTAHIQIDETNSNYNWTKNYNFTNDSFKYEIVAKKVTITISNETTTYGEPFSRKSTWASYADENHFTVTDSSNAVIYLIGASVRMTVASSGSGDYIAVGQYDITGSITTNNYSVTWVKGKLTVNKANINNTTEKSFSTPYTGSAYVANVKEILQNSGYYTLAGDMTWANATVTNSDATLSGVGSKEVTFTVKVDNHEDITGSITVTVTKAVLVINVAAGGSSVYGSALPTSSALMKYASLDMDESSLKTVTLANVITLSVNTKDARPNAGAYTYTFSYIKEADVDNYEIRFNDTNVLGVFNVTPKVITFTWDYDPSVDNYVYNGYGQQVVAKLNGVLDGDEVTIGYYHNNRFTNVGTYTASVEGLAGDDSGNYTLGSTSTIEWTINPRTIDVIWNENVTYTYNGTVRDLTKLGAIDTNGLVKVVDSLGNPREDSCGIAFIVASTADRINAGIHSVTAESTNPNYVISEATAHSTYTINQAVINITWSDEVLIYNGQVQSPKATIEGSQTYGEDKVTIKITIENGEGIDVKSVGNYIAIAQSENTNYVVSTDTASCAYNIAPKPITFDWDGVDTHLVYTGEAIAPIPNAIGKVGDDVVEFTFEGAETNVGTGYVATVTGAVKNYVIDWESQTASRTVDFSIDKGTNGFADPEYTVPTIVDQLPWTDGAPEFKWGNDTVTVKYYSNKSLTKEVSNPAKAGEGKYWVVVTVEGTENYFEYYNVFEIEVQGSLNVAIIILGSVVSVMLLAGALIVVLTTNKSGKKEKKEGGAK